MKTIKITDTSIKDIFKNSKSENINIKNFEEIFKVFDEINFSSLEVLGGSCFEKMLSNNFNKSPWEILSYIKSLINNTPLQALIGAKNLVSFDYYPIDIIKKFVSIGIPVMGHLGLTPQSINIFGGYGLRGGSSEESKKIIEDAKQLEEAGVFSIVLEKIPADLAKKITENLKIPTIGIGAGINCDGQVLVTHDMLGLFEKFTPKFSKKYAEMAQEMKECFKKYIEEVKNGKFPLKEHSY
jgi:hypothetical protein